VYSDEVDTTRNAVAHSILGLKSGTFALKWAKSHSPADRFLEQSRVQTQLASPLPRAKILHAFSPAAASSERAWKAWQGWQEPSLGNRAPHYYGQKGGNMDEETLNTYVARNSGSRHADNEAIPLIIDLPRGRIDMRPSGSLVHMEILRG
jgi:hypothetical protein